ncbi:protocadherin delta 1 [Paragonimus westermani]|uniref:Protocadherin delta 1 n=1 Tax=Paragonimus westermani TaxID=34504 RepID=A0A5J4NPD4_9TREM|nr:protocadherin delta 1 [Paragonimus westermani]
MLAGSDEIRELDNLQSSTPHSQHRVQFHLPDNTDANHLVGNIFHGMRLKSTFLRSMLNPDAFFRLTTQGDLLTRDTLDRDEVCARLDCCDVDFCRVVLEAYLFDTRPVPTTIQIQVFLADENDNAPVFPKLHVKQNRGKQTSPGPEDLTAWELTIPESATVNSRHTLPAATDRDSPRFGLLRYSLHTVDSTRSRTSRIPSIDLSPFSLIPQVRSLASTSSLPAPEIQLDRPLDREVKQVYDLYLVAEDAGQPALSTTLLIRVNVEDANDNPPKFINSSSFDAVITIPENIAVGSTIHQFSFHDDDEGPNADVLLSIDWSASYPTLNQSTIKRLSMKYSLDPKSGDLRVIQPLDYENDVERRLVLVVRAIDQGSPKLTASTSVTISVTDVNDNSPQVEILEVATMSKDTDVSAIPAVLRENNAEPHLLKLISVSDADSVSSGKIHCELADPHQTDFQLTAYSTTMYGLLNLRAFDYEREASRTGHLTVRVECVDEAEPRRTSQQWVQIPLIDVNDNWPQFSQANYQLHVTEDVEIDTEVGQVDATDADSGLSGKVTYELSSDNQKFLSYIRIDPRTGKVYTAAKLDREVLDTMDFHLTAMDSGELMQFQSTLNEASIMDRKTSNVKTNTTGLRIIVNDVNDNAPIYTGPAEIHVMENVAIGTEILSALEFTDPDLGSNGTVRVTLVDSSAFTTDLLRSSGNWRSFPVSITNSTSLVTNGEIDREKQAKMILSILATDQGSDVRLSTTVSLTVFIDDMNDNHPQLLYPRNASLLSGTMTNSEWSNQISTIPADTPANTLILTIHGKDMDANENGTVTYHLIREFKETKPQLWDKLTHQNGIHSEHDEGYAALGLPDGYAYFYVDQIHGHLKTHWGKPDTGKSTEISPLETAQNDSDLDKRSLEFKSTDSPKPGLYVLYVELRDGGKPPLVTHAHFFVNISEPIGISFWLGLFTTTNMSNTIILILITVCSLALIISLTAAIFWVRFRKDSHEPGSISYRNNSGGYVGPTVICPDSVPNGYFYPTRYPAVGSPLNTSTLDCDHGFDSQDATLLCEKERMLSSNFAENTFEYCPNGTFTRGGHCGTLLPVGLPSESTFDYDMEKPMSTSPVSFVDGIHLLPVSCSDADPRFYHRTTIHSGENAEWLAAAVDQIPVDSLFAYPTDSNYTNGLNHFDYVTGGPGAHVTNSSTGGSDSGVDSGAGIVCSTITFPVVTSSPVVTNGLRRKRIQKGTAQAATQQPVMFVHSTLPRMPPNNSHTFTMPNVNSAQVISQGNLIRDNPELDRHHPVILLKHTATSRPTNGQKEALS